MKRALLPLFFAFLLFSFYILPKRKNAIDEARMNKWVDSVFNSLTPDQRLAQLFMVAAYSNKDMKHVKELHHLISKYNIGGLIWMQGSPVKQ